MSKQTKKHHKALVFFLVAILAIIAAVNVKEAVDINKKVKALDENNKKAVFELCVYLYETDEYSYIREIYSKVFCDSDAFQFFSDSGLETEKTTEYFSALGAKFLISSFMVDAEACEDDFLAVFEEVQKSGIEKEFFAALSNELDNEYGYYVDFFESFRLKGFMESVSASLENNSDWSLRAEAYDVFSGEYASMLDFRKSHLYSWKKDEAIYKNSLNNEAEG